MSTYPIDFQDEEMDTTIEQQLTERLFKISEDLYAREWSFIGEKCLRLPPFYGKWIRSSAKKWQIKLIFVCPATPAF